MVVSRCSAVPGCTSREDMNALLFLGSSCLSANTSRRLNWDLLSEGSEMGADEQTQQNHGTTDGNVQENPPPSMFAKAMLAQRRGVCDTFKCCASSPPTAKANFYTPLVTFQNTQKTGRSITDISQTLAILKRHESARVQHSLPRTSPD